MRSRFRLDSTDETRFFRPPPVNETCGRAASLAAYLVETTKWSRSTASRSPRLRNDVTWRDLVLISIAPIGGTGRLGATRGENQWRRTIAIALDGLRGPAASTLPPD